MEGKQRKQFSMVLALMILVIPFAIALIFATIYMSSQLKSLEKSDEALYYDHLFTISSELLNADRDLYQAMLAGTRFMAYREYVGEEGAASYLSLIHI